MFTQPLPEHPWRFLHAVLSGMCGCLSRNRSIKGQLDYVVQQEGGQRHVRLGSVVHQAEDLQRALLSAEERRVTRAKLEEVCVCVGQSYW